MENPVQQLGVTKRIGDPIHGLIRLTSKEFEVLKSDFYQRLRRIKQLGIAEYVYPGATHNRFTHSLGMLQNVTEMFDAAFKNWSRAPQISGDIEADALFSKDVLEMTRLAALCHDLGHLPLSHNLEDAIDWLAETKIIKEPFRHEQISSAIIHKELSHILGDFTDDIAKMIEGDYFNLSIPMFPNFLVSSAIDGDRADYLIRDSVYCGVDYGRFDKGRLLDSLYPHRVKIAGKNYDVLGFHGKGIEAVEEFLLARHRMHQTIYFNRSVVAFEAAMKRAYYQITTDNPPWELPDQFVENPKTILDFDDANFYVLLKKELLKRDIWLKDALLFRQSVKKFGPYYYTLTSGDNATDTEKFIHLSEVRDKLEKPSRDWYKQDHWVYTERKSQTLVKPLPKSINSNIDEYDDSHNLKKSILILNNQGKLIDPTSFSAGQTFLPFIAGHTYYRFLFFCHKRDSDKLEAMVKPLQEYGETNWQQRSLKTFFE